MCGNVTKFKAFCKGSIFSETSKTCYHAPSVPWQDALGQDGAFYLKWLTPDCCFADFAFHSSEVHAYVGCVCVCVCFKQIFFRFSQAFIVWSLCLSKMLRLTKRNGRNHCTKLMFSLWVRHSLIVEARIKIIIIM